MRKLPFRLETFQVRGHHGVHGDGIGDAEARESAAIGLGRGADDIVAAFEQADLIVGDGTQARRQNERRDFAIRRKYIPHFHVQDFQNGIARREHLHFGKLRVLAMTSDLKEYLDAQEATRKLTLLQPRVRHETDEAEAAALAKASQGAVTALPTPVQARAGQVVSP